MKHIEIKYIIDDPNMTDEQYEDQEVSVATITPSDLINMLAYGSYSGQVILPKGATIGEIESVKIIV
jgi:hypothetical protein